MTANAKTLNAKKENKRLREFIATALDRAAASVGDLVVTIAVTSIALAYMQFALLPGIADLISGYYIASMVIVLLIRVTHRFDDSYTTDELGSRLEDVMEKLEEIRRNV